MTLTEYLEKGSGEIIYTAEVGSPLQQALYNNFAAQKQLEEVLKIYISTHTTTVLKLLKEELDRKLTCDDCRYCQGWSDAKQLINDLIKSN